MLSLSKLKQSFSNSKVIPALYTFVTTSFANDLRHLQNLPTVPASPAKVTVVIPNYNYQNFLDAKLTRSTNLSSSTTPPLTARPTSSKGNYSPKPAPKILTSKSNSSKTPRTLANPFINGKRLSVKLPATFSGSPKPMI